MMTDPKHASLPADEALMERAIGQAKAAAERGEVPVGAVVVADGQVIAEGGNRVEEWQDPSAHAELLALRAACRTLSKKWLIGATLYVTLEPCAMCAGAIVLARVSRVVFGASDPKSGAMQSVYTIGADGRLNHRAEVTGGVLADRCGRLLTEFFRGKRG